MARSKGQGHIFRRGKKYYVQYDVNGIRQTKSLDTTKEREAQKKAKELLEPAMQAKTKEEVILHVAKAKKIITASSILLKDVWKVYLKTPSRPDSSKGTLGNHERHWKNFTSWLKGTHPEKERLSEIDDAIAKEYANYLWTLQKKKISAGTFNYHIKSLTLITRVLIDKGGLDTNPWSEITRKSEVKQQRKEFTHEQVMTIFESFEKTELHLLHKAETEILFYIAAFTGLRLIDAVNLSWNSIKLNRNIISLIPEKTRKVQRHVNIPIHPSLKEKLKIAQEWKDDKKKVLPKMSARYLSNSSGVKKDCVKVIDFCGFKERGEGRGLNRRLYGFHSFRHFFASTCADAGVPVATLAEILGDNISTLNKYYIHAQEESRNKMIQALDNGQKQLQNQEQSPAEKKLVAIKELLDSKKKLSQIDQQIIGILESSGQKAASL